MAIARLIVCETSPRWAVALRWALLAEGGVSSVGWEVDQASSLSESWQMLNSAPASLLAVEVQAASHVELVRRMIDLPRQFPMARMILLGSGGEGAPWALFRELGAVHVASPREVDSLLRMVGQHMRRFKDEEAGLRGQIFRRLPWRPELAAVAAASYPLAGQAIQ
jgi:hypothetical protein